MCEIYTYIAEVSACTVLQCIVPAPSFTHRLVKVEISMEHWAALDSMQTLQWCACVHHMLSCKARKCAGLFVWMKRMPSTALRDMVRPFFVCVCVFQCWTLYLLRCDSFLQPYLLLCNWLFSRRQTFLSKDTNVCSVVMDLLGVQLLNLAPFCVGVFCFGGFPRQNYFHKSG